MTSVKKSHTFPRPLTELCFKKREKDLMAFYNNKRIA